MPGFKEEKKEVKYVVKQRSKNTLYVPLKKFVNLFKLLIHFVEFYLPKKIMKNI